MSDKDSRVAEIEESLKDITECSICTETFKDPRVLTCLHTFCKDCLQQLVTKLMKSTGEEVPCPICRKKFLVPVDGCDSLQKNFFMERLIEMRGNVGPSSNVHVCDACLEGDEQVHVDSSEVPTAEVYCSDCQQKLCKDCHKCHQKYRLNKNHVVLNLEEYSKIQNSSVGISAKSEFCVKHNAKPLDLYCIECKEVACSICFMEDHNTHKGSTDESASNDFKATIQQNIDSALEFMPCLKEKSEQTNTCKSIMIEKYRDLEIEINKRREELKALIDKHTNTLLSELSTKRDAYLKRMNICNDEVGILMSCLDSYKTYCKQISTFGTTSGICKAMETLIARGNELKIVCVAVIQNVLESPSLRLNPSLNSKDVESSIENYIGEIADPITQIYTAKKRSVAEFISVSKSLSSGMTAAVKGLTILGNEIFLAVEIFEDGDYLEELVEVYDLKSLWFKRKWGHSKLMGVKDVKSCKGNKCLYILRTVENAKQREVVRFDPCGTVIFSWSVSHTVTQLSVSEEQNIFCIAGNDQLEFDEYSSYGQRLFAMEVRSPGHDSSGILVVSLNADRLVIGCRETGDLGRISIVDRSGKTLNSIATVGDGEQLKWPFHLGKDQDNNVIVVDRNFGHLMAFDANLVAINEPTQIYQPPKKPPPGESLVSWNNNMEKVIIDESNRRILVGGGFSDISVIYY